MFLGLISEYKYIIFWEFLEFFSIVEKSDSGFTQKKTELLLYSSAKNWFCYFASAIACSISEAEITPMVLLATTPLLK